MMALMAIQCSSKDTSGSQGGCQAPLPQAIFDKDVSQIAKHTFKLDGHNAEENISFVNKSSLTIFQSGCDKISQEFRFQINPPSELDMASLGVEKLMYLANLDNRYMSFANWAQAIDGLRKEFTIQNEVEVEPGFFVGLDKIDGKNRTILTVKLFQK